MQRCIRRLRSQKGTETIEFVILFPMMLFLVFGSISYMLALYSKVIVVDAAREGARAQAIGAAAAGDKVKQVLKESGLNDEAAEVSVQTNEENGIEYITVHVVYNQPSLFPGLPLLIGNNSWSEYFKLRSSAVFKKEKEIG